MPKVVCFIGKVTYEKYAGSKDFSFGWQENIGASKVFVMQFVIAPERIDENTFKKLVSDMQTTVTGRYGCCSHCELP